MTYEFICEETKEILEKDFSSADVPAEFEEDGKVYRRNWMGSGVDTIIPFQWSQSVKRSKFNKSPSGKKHFY